MLAHVLLWAALAVEPDLAETQAAAARTAAGVAADDEARLARARRAHWAPLLRGQLSGKEDVKSRRGEFRLAPLVEDDTAGERGWSVGLQWDFAQLVFAREEPQLALAHAHLARIRREAAGRAAQLWIGRRRRREALAGAPPGSERQQLTLELLEATAELDALTGGLFHEALLREQAALLPSAEKP